MIEVKELRKQFGQLVAVEDLSFTAQAGQIFGLLGANGAGASARQPRQNRRSGLRDRGSDFHAARWPGGLLVANRNSARLDAAAGGLLPTGWTMNGLHRIMSFEAGAASALPELLLLASMAAIIGLLAARSFKYE